jgi:hypothetical protein
LSAAQQWLEDGPAGGILAINSLLPAAQGLVCGPPPQANRYQKGVTITRRSREPSAPQVEK